MERSLLNGLQPWQLAWFHQVLIYQFFPFPGLSELPRPFQMYATSGQYRAAAAAELCFLTCRYLIKNIQWGAAIAQWINWDFYFAAPGLSPKHTIYA